VNTKDCSFKAEAKARCKRLRCRLLEMTVGGQISTPSFLPLLPRARKPIGFFGKTFQVF